MSPVSESNPASASSLKPKFRLLKHTSVVLQSVCRYVPVGAKYQDSILTGKARAGPTGLVNWLDHSHLTHQRACLRACLPANQYHTFGSECALCKHAYPPLPLIGISGHFWVFYALCLRYVCSDDYISEKKLGL